MTCTQNTGTRGPGDQSRTLLAWADAWRQRTGAWPTADAGVIPDSGGEKWSAVDAALRGGTRGLPGGSSLARLLQARPRR